MNRIILIGNGFDLAHGLKTSYADFIDWFWEQRLKEINATSDPDWDYSNDVYYECKKSDFFTIKFNKSKGKERIDIRDYNAIRNEQQELTQKPKFETVEDLKKNVVTFRNKFLEILVQRQKMLNWVDIEQLYFDILCNCKKRYSDEKIYEIYTVEQLNREFKFIKDELYKFLETRNAIITTKKVTASPQKELDAETKDKKEDEISKKQKEYLNDLDFKNLVQDIKELILLPSTDEAKINKLLLLNFNYTNTLSELYNNIKGKKPEIYPIHGNIEDNSNPMIFGYGDEKSIESSDIEELNNNEFLENVKSVKYIETDYYKKLLNFIKEEYDVFVFGHSCGNSDRTLLKELFENEHCKEIRCFYYKDEKNKTDDFNKTVDNIYRKFDEKNKNNFRGKIVRKGPEDNIPQFPEEKSPFKKEEKKSALLETDKCLSCDLKKPVEEIKNDGRIGISSGNISKIHIAENNMILVKGGKYKIKEEEYGVKDFYIGKFLVTQRQWQEIIGDNPSWFKDKNIWRDIDNNNLPVECVSWDMVIDFCIALNKKYGLNDYYQRKEGGVTVVPSANGFRLPSEIEWEYAAAGGTQHKGYEYAGSDNVDEVAWYWKNSEKRTHTVGTKRPNELGIHDMSGNVWEWCNEDWYIEATHALRVIRGGSWNYDAEFCRVSYRSRAHPGDRSSDIGFRVACSL